MCQRKKSRTRLLAVPRREERESAPAAAGLGCGGLLGRRETRGLGLGRKATRPRAGKPSLFFFFFFKSFSKGAFEHK